MEGSDDDDDDNDDDDMDGCSGTDGWKKCVNKSCEEQQRV